MCDHRLNDGVLVCTRTDEHTTGHVYAASAGADLSGTELEMGDETT